jgi:hypothetical protein
VARLSEVAHRGIQAYSMSAIGPESKPAVAVAMSVSEGEAEAGLHRGDSRL